MKPRTTFAPPPVSAVLTIVLFVSTALYYFPEFDHPDPDVYTQRVFPDLISVEVLLYTRVFFTVVCFYGFIMAWFLPNEVVTPPHRPQSKLARVPIVLNGFKKNWPFTGMSWILLGLQFGASSYITYCQVTIKLEAHFAAFGIAVREARNTRGDKGGRGENAALDGIVF